MNERLIVRLCLVAALLLIAAVSIYIVAEVWRTTRETPPGTWTLDEKLQGTWTMVAMEGMNGPLAVEVVRKLAVNITFDKDQLTREMSGSISRGMFKLDTSKQPKQIDLLFRAGDFTSPEYGIYEVEGDTLRICYHIHDAKHRPREFKPKGDPLVNLMIFKRDNP